MAFMHVKENIGEHDEVCKDRAGMKKRETLSNSVMNMVHKIWFPQRPI